jgi:hypothetical protein
LNSGTLDASASVVGGNGGTVSLKNMGGATIHTGKILAEGGQGGVGGNAEISGLTVGFTGAVDLTAIGGKTGNLLLDPATLEVITGGSGSIISGQNDSTSTTIDPTTVEAALGTSNVTLNADNNVTVTNGITWSGANTLTLSTNNPGSSVDINAPISGFELNVFSPNISINNTTVTTTAPENQFFGQIGLLLFNNFVGTVGQINIANSTLNGSSMEIGANAQAMEFGSYGTSQVSINSASAINLTIGSNPPTSNFFLGIYGASVTAGVAGVDITNSSITTTGGASGGDYVDIEGTGMVAPGSNAIGVDINDSMLTNGSSGLPGDVDFDIKGESDLGLVTTAPGTFGTADAYGILITNNSVLSTYSTGKMTIKGKAYADDTDTATGVAINLDSTVQTIDSRVKIDGEVRAETLPDTTQFGASYTAVGVNLVQANITASGINTQKDTAVSIFGEVLPAQVTATDNGDPSIAPNSYGVNINTSTISASNDTTPLSVPILVVGESGGVSSSSSQVATSVGLSISGGSTITNSGDGATLLGGLSGIATGGSVTGQNVFANGVEIAGTSGSPEAITATGGGSIGIAGGGGSVGSGSTGEGIGVDLNYTNVSTTSGVVVMFAAAGSEAGGSTVNLTGLNLVSSTVQTGSSGGTQLPDGGGNVPPLLMIYATDSSAVYDLTSHALTFQPGSSTGYAIQENGSSSLVTNNLVMGNFYDLFSGFAPATLIANLPTFAAFNSYITGQASSTISSQGLTLNPSGIIDLTSTLNQITNLDSAYDGSGGFNLYDSTSLTVDPIGGNDTLNYGEIDGPGLGPVSITVAPDQDLTLSRVSPLTGQASSGPIIDSSGQITLTTSGTGQFINDGGASALTSGSQYVIYANDPSQVTLGGLIPTTPLFDTLPGTVSSPSGKTIAFATDDTAAYNPNPPLPNPNPTPGMPGPIKTTDDTLQNYVVITPPPVQQPVFVTVIPGTGGVPGGWGHDANSVKMRSELKNKLVGKFGSVLGARIFAVVEQDLKDGSPLNTNTLMEKWVANTGFSKLVWGSGNAELADGLAQPLPDASLFFDQSQGGSQTLDELSAAAFGHVGNRHH